MPEMIAIDRDEMKSIEQHADNLITEDSGSADEVIARNHDNLELKEQLEKMPGRQAKQVDLFQVVEQIKKEWERTFDCMGDMIILADWKGEIRRCNKAVREFTGRPNERIIGTHWQDFLEGVGLAIRANCAAGGQTVSRRGADPRRPLFHPGDAGYCQGAQESASSAGQLAQLADELQLG